MFKDFATPVRIQRCTSNEELIYLANSFNGILPCYASIYWYDADHKSYIDKIFFDIDGDLESTKKLVKYLIDNNLKFRIYHSGRGWHIYIDCTDGTASNLKVAQISILHESGASADQHIIGDVSRISRIPNTWNFKSQSYCIPIKVEELGHEDGSKQRFEQFVYGSKLLDLSSYTENNYEYLKPEIVTDLNFSSSISLIPCIRNIIAKSNPRHDERFLLAVYLSFVLRRGKDLTYFDSKILIEKILEYMNNFCNHWIDYNAGKTRYYLNNIIPKFNPIVGCKFIKQRNCCISCIKGEI